MMQSGLSFQPGNLVRARGREWVVLGDSRPDWLRLRPLGGADEDVVGVIPDLELDPVESASFHWPDPTRPGTHAGALLLRDALRLKLRAGAGPFRSFGNIGVEPRAYQLVPLLMALRLSTVRLLIADDVGIGKTIEAGLIVRELLDRGEIGRAAVLCPPHLVDQWQGELADRFHLPAVALTAATANRVERELPHGVSLFEHHRIVVVSLDYIKSERHRDHFLSIAPECLIVDEAHTCATGGRGKQLRYELLQRLLVDPERHLIMLTATPHSGDEAAFYNLIALLDPEFAGLQGHNSADHPLRQRLARHFVQRRRKDIEEWQIESSEGRAFPRRMKTEITYQLSGEWGAFFDSVQAYCRDLAESMQHAGGGGARLIWYATLALLRCVASSPAAAVKALTTRLEGAAVDEASDLLDDRLHDGQADDLSGSDLEPPAQLQDTLRLQSLIGEAQRLSGRATDPKLSVLVRHLQELLSDGFHVVVFCRYVATAHYVAEHLRRDFPDVLVEAVTGEQTPDERKDRVESMTEANRRVLVATDCLSEGINLQHLFTAVVHYDLAWNPTRHEQREGRVDRFGQEAKSVRCTMLYGQDNPVDGFVLNVILRKGEAIQKELGVLVPMPEDELRINQALVKAALMKRSDAQHNSPQASFDFGESEQLLEPLQAQWRDALDKAKANRTVFAQRRIRPDEVLPEWRKQQQALGDQADVHRFLRSACARLNSPLEPLRKDHVRFLPQHFPEPLRLRLEDEGLALPHTLDLAQLHRSHPLVTVIAEHLLEDTLQGEQPMAARCAATVTGDVEVVTTLYLLRLRHQLSYVRRRQPHQLMAEETLTLAVRGRASPVWSVESSTDALLQCQPSGNLSPAQIQHEIEAAMVFLRAHPEKLESLADERAQALLEDHRRVREAARDVGQYSVSPCLPLDLIGVYVLLPDAL